MILKSLSTNLKESWRSSRWLATCHAFFEEENFNLVRIHNLKDKNTCVLMGIFIDKVCILQSVFN